ncbi:MAG: copper-binding protein [Acidobacteriaceae bacterium]|nr:copper-binding protein [Acidobacteriaceae bacterium]
MRPFLFALVVSIALAGCGRKAEAPASGKQYPMTGKIVALDSAHQTATIDAAAIPNFMEAMTMEYPIRSREEFNRLHVGDRIKAVVNVDASGEEYSVSGIQKQNASQ